jgi:nucleoside-diphosphate-sugar epimerase
MRTADISTQARAGHVDGGPPALRRHRPGRVTTAKTGKTYLVTGGHGMLGSHLCEALLARGEDRVRVFDLAPSPLFDEEVRRGAVTFHRGDLRVRADVEAACRGVDVVFHTAASVNYWADLPFEHDAIHAVNVTGTENVAAACVAAGVGQLVATSSTSVVVPHDVARRPLVLADERTPPATAPFLCHYIRTKGLAERAVLAADGRGGLSTAALRPGGMFGPRDQLLTAAVAAGLPGIGLATNALDHIYVENVVHAFLLLEAKLRPGAPVCGRAYFVTGYPPATGSETYLAFTTKFAAHFGRRFRLLPPALPGALAAAVQAAVRASRGRATRHLGTLAKLRPASLTLARATYTFSHCNAEADFGYAPLYTPEEGMALTAKHWRGE